MPSQCMVAQARRKRQRQCVPSSKAGLDALVAPCRLARYVMAMPSYQECKSRQCHGNSSSPHHPLCHPIVQPGAVYAVSRCLRLRYPWKLSTARVLECLCEPPSRVKYRSAANPRAYQRKFWFASWQDTTITSRQT